MIDLGHAPKNPGCYLFKDSKGKVIYVGKAKSLVNRVKSYFAREHEDAHRSVDPKLRSIGVKTNVLVSHIKSVDFMVTDSEVEALILENNLIKKYKPKYNIDLKDSKRYAFVQVTGEMFPRLLIARKRLEIRDSKLERASRFYGPFVSGMSRDYVLHALRKIFKIRTCVKLPKKVCMRFQIGLCSGPCEGKISKTDYLENVKNAEMVLKGKTKAVVEILSKRMKGFSSEQDFERALVLREQIRAVKDLGEKQKMERDKKYDEDFINWIISGDKVYLILFNARRGILENKQFFEFDWSPNFLEEFLVQFYSDYDCPKEVVLPEDVDSGLKEFIERLGGKVVVPKMGEKVKLLELVKKNVDLAVFGNVDKVKELKEKLGLIKLPRVIECFDVSHLSGTDVVASMVQFRDGVADKSNYRKFRIRGGDVNDDYAAMREVISRRYHRLAEVRGIGSSEARDEKMEAPDLIVVDGGKGQLGVAVGVLEELKLGIEVIGLAKAEETVILPKRQDGDLGVWGHGGLGREVRLDKKSGALKLLIEIRDEAHRFAIGYQRLLRGKKIRE